MENLVFYEESNKSLRKVEKSVFPTITAWMKFLTVMGMSLSGCFIYLFMN